MKEGPLKKLVGTEGCVTGVSVLFTHGVFFTFCIRVLNTRKGGKKVGKLSSQGLFPQKA